MRPFVTALLGGLTGLLPLARLAAQADDWRRGGTCYEVFLRSFQDSDGDGIGDIPGLISRLDYINDGDPAGGRDLGADCIWLMPVAESPSYHGYDVADYYRVEADYGTNADFRRLMEEAHRRGIRVLVDMVLNHSSSQNPWFRAALRDPASPYRSWYRFQPTEGPKGPWGMQAWRKSPVRDEWYYGIFDDGMPDLDYHNSAVRAEAMRIADFWLRDMGVDGFRLDAIPYLVEDGDCAMGCAGTHQFLREYAEHLRTVRLDAYTVGEAWGNIDALLPYYPDQLTSHFAFEIADSLIANVRNGNATGILPLYLRLQESLPPWRWSPLLSNHDGTRSMTLFGGDRARARVAATLLLTLPGLPFVYYGEEIGMTGEKPDPRLRTPMAWQPGAGGGFTTGTPWIAAQPDSMVTTVAAQDADPRSLLNLYRRLIHLRRSHPALVDGRLVALETGDPHVLAYLRRGTDRSVLVLANLGDASAERVTVGAPRGTLPAGRYRGANLLGDGAASRLVVGADGTIARQAPVAASLPPHSAIVLDLRRE